MQFSNGYLEHRTIDGDRWDLLAYKYYGDARKQTVLQDANRHLFIDPITVPPLILWSGLTLSGLTLIVPVLEDDVGEDHDLSPWKRKVPSYD